MKLQDVQHKHPPFDVASGLAESLLQSGKYEQVRNVVVAPVPNTRWSLNPGPLVDDTRLAPAIHWNCSSCGNAGYMTGPTCHKTQRVFHCGTAEAVPSDIAQQYEKLRQRYDAKHKRKSSGNFDAVRDAHVEEMRIRCGELLPKSVVAAGLLANRS